MTDSVGDARTAPAASRNREPIAAILRTWLPPKGLVLEVASGTGEHALWFSRALPGVTWQPTERDPASLASIAAWRAAEGPGNLLPPVALDAAAPKSWPITRAAAVVAINMIHIAPWDATLGLMAGAARALSAGGVLFLYGPFIEPGQETVPSNIAFDLDLRARDPAWGLRDLGAVTAVAARNGLVLARRHEMPANNLGVLFREA